MEFRLNEIIKQIKERDIKGLIHYTQCFCFRQIEDILVKNRIDIPVLTLEGDKPGYVDARTKMRIENFMDMI
jgi:benzoyl-CoA reductase/2-hydroxyglutaryl-CoA dehydratase subunit BcrC/BadD/HgdB